MNILKKLKIDDPNTFWFRFNSLPSFRITPDSMRTISYLSGATSAIFGNWCGSLLSVIEACDNTDFNENSVYNIWIILRYMNYKFGKYDKALEIINNKQYDKLRDELVNVLNSYPRDEVCDYIKKHVDLGDVDLNNLDFGDIDFNHDLTFEDILSMDVDKI